VQLAGNAPAFIILHLKQANGEFSQALVGLAALDHLRFELRSSLPDARFKNVERGLHGCRSPEVDSRRDTSRRRSERIRGAALQSCSRSYGCLTHEYALLNTGCGLRKDWPPPSLNHTRASFA